MSKKKETYPFIFAAVGYAIGGFWGAILGAPLGFGIAVLDERHLGHMADRAESMSGDDEDTEETDQAAFDDLDKLLLISASALVGKLISINGEFNEDQWSVVKQFFYKDFQFQGMLSDDDLSHLIAQGGESKDPESEYMWAVEGLLEGNWEMRERFVDFLFRVADANGIVTIKEDEMIGRLAVIFKLNENDFIAIRRKYLSLDFGDSKEKQA